MKTILFALLSIALASCSMQDENHYSIDPSVRIFVDRFYAEARAHGINLQQNRLTLILKNLGEHAGAGVEGVSVYDMDEINLDINYVINKLKTENHFDSLDVEYVVFHELSHYLLHRGHVESYSIMTPDGLFKADFSTDPDKRKILIDELFKANS